MSLGGRGRVAFSGATGRAHGEPIPQLSVQAHVGTSVLSVTDPGPRDLDVEVGYALDAFPGARAFDRHGGYAGVHAQLWQVDGARLSIGGDVDVLWGFDERLALGATLSAGIEAYAACEGGMGGGDLLYAGVIGWGRGEWGLGVQVQASYRFVDGEHYASIGGSISLRFPAGIGFGYVTALALLEASGGASGRASGSSSSSSSTTTTTSTSTTTGHAGAPFGFCEHPHPYVAPDERAPEEPDRWRCVAISVDGQTREEGPVSAPDLDRAVALCRREFAVANADGARCDCAPMLP